MTIGELLKEYRIGQGKTQKEFINDGMIVSQSYYSKVEKNANKITVDNLVDLLHYNNIPTWEFFSRLNQTDEMKRQEIENFENTMLEAFYDNDKDKILQLKPLIVESNLSPKDKEEELLEVEALLEAMKAPDETPNIELRTKIKEKIFDIPNFNKTKVTLFCNNMQFYDFETEKLIGKRIIDQYINTKDIKMQIAMQAIIDNILAFSLKEKKKNQLIILLKVEKRLKPNPSSSFINVLFISSKILLIII
ncbi:helix-turn-helix domain-containing protein [Lactobacillus intestinalis]|uniref:helix-turn-helix domain-containing protein n=2 Tax=Lactobacillus TaxID=1578 RepID=UPI0026EB0CAE|nr:helix-turn-helix transcriptional regulator [Lactobacillus intestinalis]